MSGLLLTVAGMSGWLWSAEKIDQQTWTGKMYNEFFSKVAPESNNATSMDISLELQVNKKGQFTGKWTEGNRALYIAGTINKNQFVFRATGIDKGNWQPGVVKNFHGVGQIKNGVMQGYAEGIGAIAKKKSSFQITKR